MRVKSMVLAAGMGTRLKPLTDHVPKPLVPVGDSTPLACAVAAVRRAGARDVVVNAHHHAAEIVRACDALAVRCSVEDVILGTAGGLTKAREMLGDGDVLVWNADVVAPDVRAAELFAKRRGSATLLVRELPGAPRGAGNVGWDGAGRIVRLRKETSRAGEAHAGEFLGIHVVGDDLPRVASGCLVGDVYLPALARGAELYAVCTDASAIDIGTKGAYLDANLAWLDREGLASFVADGARVAAEITRSVVLAGADVRAPIRDSVVWPLARVDTPLARGIATPFGVVDASKPATATPTTG